MCNFILFGRHYLIFLLAGSLNATFLRSGLQTDPIFLCCIWNVTVPKPVVRPNDVFYGHLMFFAPNISYRNPLFFRFNSPKIGNLFGVMMLEVSMTWQEGVVSAATRVRVYRRSSHKDGFVDDIEIKLPTPTVTDLSKNRVDVWQKYRVVDPIDALPNQTYWLRAAVHGEFPMYNAQTAVNFQERNSYMANLAITVESQAHHFFAQGHILAYSVSISHKAYRATSATAENITVEIFMPPTMQYRGFAWLSQNQVLNTVSHKPSANKLTIWVPVLPLLVPLKGTLTLSLDPKRTVPLIWNGGAYDLVLPFSAFYCWTNGHTLYQNNVTVGPLQARRREEGTNFRLKNTPTRQCLSYNDETSAFIFSNDCQKNVFRFSEYGSLQSMFQPQSCFTCNVMSSALKPCLPGNKDQPLYLDKKGRLSKVLSNLRIEFLDLFFLRGFVCLLPGDHGNQFDVLPELEKGTILSLPSKSFLQATLEQAFVFCSRHNRRAKRKCYFTRNNGKSWTGLHPLVSSLYGYDKSTNEMYFIDHFGKDYLVAKLGEKGKMLFCANAEIFIDRAKKSGEFVRAVVQDDNLPDFSDNILQTNWKASPRGLHYRQRLSISGTSWRQLVDYGF